MPDFSIAQIMTNLLGFADVAVLVFVFFVLMKLMNCCPELSKTEFTKKDILPVILFFFAYRLLWFFISVYSLDLSFYELVVFSNFLLLVSGILFYRLIARVVGEYRRVFNAS
ncbi:MAG: hypothetical protein ABH986_06560 [archaeon]